MKTVQVEKDHSILYLTTFPPRKCGIATFTHDVSSAMDEMLSPTIKSKIIALNPNEVLTYPYPKKVIMQLTQDNENEYVQIARKINRMDEVRLVSIQHEFGIFGGEFGDYLVPFVQTLRKPSVINFHTVLPNPDEERYKVVRLLAENVSAITVMTGLSKKILIQDYSVPERKIRMIPHGIHSQPFMSSRQAKMALGFSDRVVLSTFGLLNRSKGLEYIIDSLPEVKKRFPNFVYIYFGATHPFVLNEEGESYRNEIIDKIYHLGLFDHVRLYNKFFPLGELLRFLRATDIYISPGLEPNQAVSGTLSYALGAGRPVISTAFSNAREAITDDVGILVDFRNPQAYTEAILRLLEDEELRVQMGKNAYYKTRSMIWPNVAIQYAKLFSQHARKLTRISVRKSLPALKIDHLVHLTDNFGIIQSAKLTRPDVKSGYTLDDNARALAFAATYYGKLGRATKTPYAAKQRRDLLRLVNVYLNFIIFVSQTTGQLPNYVQSNRTLDNLRNNKINLDDANARALHALAITATTGALPGTVRKKAKEILESRVDDTITFDSPRATAVWIKALCVLFSKNMEIRNIDLIESIQNQCDQLVSLYNEASSSDWLWFEEYLTYSNAVMPEALFLGYRATGVPEHFQVGRTTLDFLIKESFADSLYTPIGYGGRSQKDSMRDYYAQQPEEVKAMVYALKACYSETKDRFYLDLMHYAFYWFVGDNTLNQVVYDRASGGCYDGVGKTTINLNQGAESTICYLMARLAF